VVEITGSEGSNGGHQWVRVLEITNSEGPVEIMNSEGVETMGPAVRVGPEDSNGVHQWVSVLKTTGSEGLSGGHHGPSRPSVRWKPRVGGFEWWKSRVQEGLSGGNHGFGGIEWWKSRGPRVRVVEIMGPSGDGSGGPEYM
jgi:hypothetical protein